MRSIMWLLVPLLCLPAGASGADAIDPSEAIDVVAGLVEEVAEYTRRSPEAPGAFAPWESDAVRTGEPMLVHRYPELEPSYYLIPLTDDTGAATSFVTVNATTGAWQAYWESGSIAAFPAVSRTLAVELGSREFGRECAAEEFRVVSMPDKRLYWHARPEPPGGEVFISISNPGDVRVGLDAELMPEAIDRGPAPGPEPSPESDRQQWQSESRPDRYPSSYDITGVPHYYQQTSYNCGPAALEMMFDYWGEHVNQTDIARVANTTSSAGTYARDLRRAAHFSGMSTSKQWPYFQGYSERALGYAANENQWSFPDDNDPEWPDRYNDLKTLVSSDYPIIILCWYDASHASGHFRVVKGYDDSTSVFIVHDPWYDPPYQGPNVHFNQAFLVDDLWRQWYRWAMFAAPWDVELTVPPAVPSKGEFAVSAGVAYPGPHPFEGDYTAGTPTASIALPQGFQLAALETAVKPLPGIGATGTADTVSWQVLARCDTGYATIEVGARGTVSGMAFSYPSYADTIGGGGGAGTSVYASPRVIYVDAGGTGDELMIQDGIDATVCDGDTVVVLPGTYTGSGNRDLTFDGRNITVIGQGGPANTIIDCQTVSRAFHFENVEDTTAVVSGFTIRNGGFAFRGRGLGDYDGGGIFCEWSSPTLRNLVIENCWAYKGGGIAWAHGAPVLEDVLIVDCAADTGAGAYGEGTIIWNRGADSTEDLRGRRQDFAKLRNVEFLENSADYRGGGMYCLESYAQLRDVTFRENYAQFGGGMYCVESYADLERTLFAGNESEHGAAVYFENDYGTGIMRSTIAHNVATGDFAAAVEFDDSYGSVLYSIISHTVGGSAVRCIGDAWPCIDHCDIYANAGGDTICGECDFLRNENISYNPLYCDGEAYDFTLHTDSRCLPAQNPWGEQIGRYGAGACGLSDVDDGAAPVTSLALHAPSPNPFARSSTIVYEAPTSDDNLMVRVYDVSGRLVTTLHDGPVSDKRGTLRWDGRDEAGLRVASGVYFVRGTLGDETTGRKLVVLR